MRNSSGCSRRGSALATGAGDCAHLRRPYDRRRVGHQRVSHPPRRKRHPARLQRQRCRDLAFGRSAPSTPSEALQVRRLKIRSAVSIGTPGHGEVVLNEAALGAVRPQLREISIPSGLVNRTAMPSTSSPSCRRHIGNLACRTQRMSTYPSCRRCRRCWPNRSPQSRRTRSYATQMGRIAHLGRDGDQVEL